MTFLPIAAGSALLMVVLADIAVTTLAPSAGAGPVTRMLSRGVWWLLLRSARRFRHRLLRAAGPVTLALVISMWLLGLIWGWALVFTHDASLSGPDFEGAVPLFGRLHFAASLVIGRGTAGVTPTSDLWQTLQALAAASGVTLLSLSIAYVLPVVNAVVRKREVASYISSLGSSPADILERAWEGDGFGELSLHFIALTPMISRVAQEHLAYPILHQFHSGDRFTALGPSIVVLDETMTLLELAVEDHGIDRSAIAPCRTALDAFLRTLRGVAVRPADEPLRPPVLAGYRETDLPIGSDDEIRERLEERRDRRRMLAGFLLREAWTPEEVMGFDPDRFRDDADRVSQAGRSVA